MRIGYGYFIPSQVTAGKVVSSKSWLEIDGVKGDVGRIIRWVGWAWIIQSLSSHTGKSLAVHSFTIGSSNLPLDMPKWNENSCLCINQYMDIYRIFIHNCSKMETIQASFNLWMDKQAIVYLCSGPCSANSWDVQLHGWSSVHSSKWRKADLKAMCWRVQFLRHSE